MKITPLGQTPAKVNVSSQPSSGQSAKERAISLLTGGNQSQNTPVQDPSNISVEELGALKQSEGESKSELAEALSTKNNNSDSTESKDESPADTGKDKSSEDELSAQYAQLARKERAILAKAKELKLKEEAIKAQEAKFQQPAARSDENQVDTSKYVSVEELKKNALQVLTKHGITYDAVTEQALNQPSPEQLAQQQVIEELRSKILELEGKQESTVKTIEEAQKQQYQQAINQLKNETRRLVQSDESFETIAATDSYDDVVELIETHFSDTGEILSVEEAAKMVEEHLVEEAYKLARLKKIQARLAPKPAEKSGGSSEAVKSSQETKPAVKTLTNAAATQRPMSAVERAIAAFKGENQS